MQCAEDEQARLRRGQRERDRFEVAHFADQHDVGVFAQRGFQAAPERWRNASGTSRCVMMLRLLLCTNSIGSSIVTMCREEVVVDVIDQRRQRRRFAGSGRPGDEHQSAAQLAELFHHRRNPELLQRGDLRRNQAEDGAVAVGLLEIIATEARLLIHLVGEIEIAAFLEKRPALGSADFAQHVDRLFARDWLLRGSA